MKLPLAISVGDPAGIGPEVSLRAASARTDEAIVVFGDADRLEALALVLGIPGARLQRRAMAADLALEAGDIALVHTGTVSDATISARRPTPEGGAAQLAALDAAVDAVRSGRARALCTGPTSKQAITAAGHPFVGQTEHLARAAGLADDAVTMMFLGPTLRVALVTTHLSIRAAADAITGPRVERTLVHLTEVLVRARLPRRPRLVVTGLNPHAGEGGLFGAEEARVIAPALGRAAASVASAVELVGLRPAESAFRAAARGEIDGVVAMIHDQATIASKLLDFGEAVNVTWGLPFVRTSVDHGVAYDAARSGTADSRGMAAAIRMAQVLS